MLRFISSGGSEAVKPVKSYYRIISYSKTTGCTKLYTDIHMIMIYINVIIIITLH